MCISAVLDLSSLVVPQSQTSDVANVIELKALAQSLKSDPELDPFLPL